MVKGIDSSRDPFCFSSVDLIWFLISNGVKGRAAAAAPLPRSRDRAPRRRGERGLNARGLRGLLCGEALLLPLCLTECAFMGDNAAVISSDGGAALWSGSRLSARPLARSRIEGIFVTASRHKDDKYCSLLLQKVHSCGAIAFPPLRTIPPTSRPVTCA